MSKFKHAAVTTAVLFSAMGCAPASWAQSNNFFGSGPYLPGAVGSLESDKDTPAGSLLGGSSNSSSAGAQSAPATSGSSNINSGGLPGAGPDNTADEKRMQKKYKANIAYFKVLITKGEAMMKNAPNPQDKNYKHGKILKETGEKHLAELQTSSPFQLDPTLADEGEKKSKKDKKDKS